MTPEEIKKQMMESAGIRQQQDHTHSKADKTLDASIAASYRGSIKTENSDAQPATAETIHEAVWDDDARGSFLIFEKPRNEFYMQALTADSSEGFIVEYREGSADAHFASDSNFVTRGELEKLLLKYAADNESFKTDLEWHRISPEETRPTRVKSMPLAIVLAVLFGPFGLFYVSWKRALAMLLVFIVGVSMIPNNGFVTLLLWLVAPVVSIFALGIGPRQPPPA